MQPGGSHGRLAAALVLVVLAVGPVRASLPTFGRDTVLVWTVRNQDETSRFVVRIAEFRPSRFIEWETTEHQGTIHMSSDALTRGRAFVNARLFDAGVDTRGKDATTLWLSEWAYRELKARRRVKLGIDAVDGWMTVDDSAHLTVDVNRTPTEVTVIKVKDDRGQERWFLDDPDNPLLVKHLFRTFTQTLTSVTTDRPNTLRWIKGKKLTSPR